MVFHIQLNIFQQVLFFELGHETILELKTDSQPLQVEALEITFEEPQIVESTEVVDSSSITSLDAS